jgi:hypothetical protein
VVYNAAFALYELAGSEAAAGAMLQAGAAASLKQSSRSMQVRCGWDTDQGGGGEGGRGGGG